MKGIFNKALSIALLMSVAGASAWQMPSMPTFSMPKVSMPKVSTPAFVKAAVNGIAYITPNFVKTGAVATKNGVVYAGTKSLNGVKCVGTKSFDGIKYAGTKSLNGSKYVGNGIVAGYKVTVPVVAKCVPSIDTVKATVKAQNLGGKIGYATLATAGLGAVAYKYGLGSKAVNVFKGKEDSAVVFFKSQIVEMNKVLAALEKNEDVVFNDFYLIQGSGLTQKADFDAAFAAYTADENDTNKAAFKAVVNDIIATAESNLK